MAKKFWCRDMAFCWSNYGPMSWNCHLYTTHGFEWMESSELENWRNHSCILEVELEYPRSLKDLHSDYPLAPKQIKVNKIQKKKKNQKKKKKSYSQSR